MEYLARLIEKLEAVDIGGVRIIPKGADKPIKPYSEDDYRITPDHVRQAARQWNRLMPEYAGIFDAKVKNANPDRSS